MAKKIYAETSVRIQEALRFIRDYESEHGYPPTLTEIAEQAKTSTCVASLWVKKARAEGYLATPFLGSGRLAPRTLRLTQAGEELVNG